MNISGNYRTADKEVAIVKRILDEKAIPYQEVKKYDNADDGDVAVVLPDGREVIIEVKEEEYKRFPHYGDLGIDYISVFYFKQGVDSSAWKTPHKPEDLAAFKQVIDMTKPYKGGKVFYSKSHLWLFFVMTPDDKFYYCKFFKGDGMTSPEFIDYIENNCKFAANLKSKSQMSYYDRHSSACFFLNHKDEILDNYEVDVAEYLKSE